MPRFDVIETNRLTLRRWRDADREPFAKLNGDTATESTETAGRPQPRQRRHRKRVDQPGDSATTARGRSLLNCDIHGGRGSSLSFTCKDLAG
jgi:hypothetical protein